MTQAQEAEQRLIALASQPAQEREAAMRRGFEELARLPEAERQTRIRPMLQTLYTNLSDDQLRSYTISRMRVWLQMDAAMADTLAKSYDIVIDLMPGPIAMKHIALIQTLSREFSLEEQNRLRAMSPRVFGVLPSVAPVHAVAPTKEAVEAERKKSGLKFWKR
jgi:hypothetical protein